MKVMQKTDFVKSVADRANVSQKEAKQVIDAALDAGALGSSISGAGPSIFALCRSERSAAEVAAGMVAAFAAHGLAADAVVSPADCPGARRV
jgi:homoserine kinase